ncbi:hypothetical protein AB5I41_11155 [Sphingomonas sp. MMS24-JH45]
MTLNSKSPSAADLALGGFYSDEKLKMGAHPALGGAGADLLQIRRRSVGIPAGTAQAPVVGRPRTCAARPIPDAVFAHMDFALHQGQRDPAPPSIQKKRGSFRNPYFEPSPLAVFKLLGVQPGPAYGTAAPPTRRCRARSASSSARSTT